MGSGFVNKGQGKGGQYGSAYPKITDNGNSGASKTIDLRTGNVQKITMTDNCTLTFTAPTAPCLLTLIMIQDGTGTRTPTFPGTVKWNGGTEPTWSEVAGETNILSMYYDGANYLADGWVQS